MAKRDWKKALGDTIDALEDRFRDLLGALDDLLTPPPEPIPVPVPADRPGSRRPIH